ncbi:hypothetical protein HQ487_03065 [Candidatus Uhrbacteria bacterium]|nr:hypothetical protein [Candidatus Uhrbacteria bacterium]
MDHLDQQIINALKELKHESSFGADLDTSSIHEKALLRNGFEIPEKTSPYVWRDYVEFYLHDLTHNLLRPLSAAMAVFVFAIMGWVSVANASVNAIPGEKLYPVKLAMERAQITLAVGDDQRANLRVEFAGRRLEEMVQLAVLLNDTHPETVQLAANRFKTEVENIKDELQVEDSTASQQEFAKAVGRKVEAYSSTVASSSSALPDDVRGDVEDLLEETKDQVVEVIITAHEVEQDEESAHELDTSLAQKITSIEAQFGEVASETLDVVEALRSEGLYRRAFQVLKDFEFEQQIAVPIEVSAEITEVPVEISPQE